MPGLRWEARVITAFILVPAALAVGALFLVGQSRYGHLRLSEVPGALWILLACRMSAGSCGASWTGGWSGMIWTSRKPGCAWA